METQLIIFFVLIGFSAFFSGVETAYFSLTPGRVRAMVRNGLKQSGSVEKLKRNTPRLLATILIGNNIVNISAAAIATEISINMFGSIGVGIASGTVTLIVLVFGEIVPKSLAVVHASVISRWSAPVLRTIAIVLWPLITLFEKFIHILHALFPGSRRRTQVSEEEILSMMHVGVEEGSVEHHERRFIERLFRFNDLPVSRIMVPFDEVVALDGDVPTMRAAHFVGNSGYSRFPVNDGVKENIIGLVHLKDILRASNSDKREESVKSIAAPIGRISSGTLLDDAFRMMQNNRQHIYLVEDNAGEMVGLVTMEDIIEELLGEIHDESDYRKDTA